MRHRRPAVADLTFHHRDIAFWMMDALSETPFTTTMADEKMGQA